MKKKKHKRSAVAKSETIRTKKKPSEIIERIVTTEDVPAAELKASNLITMIILLAEVQNCYLRGAETTLAIVRKNFNFQLKDKISKYLAEITKLKGMTADLASIVQSLHGKEEESFNRDADYLEELIPLFLDRIGDCQRTDYVAQCILHTIYDGYTSKLHQFEEHGHKHLTRSKDELERIRKIKAWQRNEKRRKEAILAGRPAPPKLPWPFQDEDKQIYIDF